MKNIASFYISHHRPSCKFINAYPEYFDNFDVWMCSLPESVRFFIALVMTFVLFFGILWFLKKMKEELSI